MCSHFINEFTNTSPEVNRGASSLFGAKFAFLVFYCRNRLYIVKFVNNCFEKGFRWYFLFRLDPDGFTELLFGASFYVKETILKETGNSRFLLNKSMPVAGGVRIRVARWFSFKPKIPIRVHFWGSCNGRYWYNLWPFGIFYGTLVYFVVILYSFPVLVYCPTKNLATLVRIPFPIQIETDCLELADT
jgi:hypothetical protein